MTSRTQASWLPAGDDHLLLTAALHPDERGTAAWRALRPRFDVHRVDAEQMRLFPLVLRTLAATDTADPDHSRMLGLRRILTMRSVLVMVRAAEAISALTDAGIRAMALKGMALVVTAYGEVSLRPMADADLLVAPTHVPAAVEVLRTLGYEGRSPTDRRFASMRHGIAY